MPPDHSVRADDDEGLFPTRPKPERENPEKLIEQLQVLATRRAGNVRKIVLTLRERLTSQREFGTCWGVAAWMVPGEGIAP